MLLLSHRNTQRLPDMAASTLLRLLKPRLLSLLEHLGGITQIFPHRDVDMWGRIWMSRFRGAWTSLNFYKEYLFGFSLCNFRDLIYAQTVCNTPKRKENWKSHHMTPLTAYRLFSWWNIFQKITFSRQKLHKTVLKVVIWWKLCGGYSVRH